VGLKPILRTTTSFSALTLLVGSFDLQKPVPDMTYNVFSGTLNPTQQHVVSSGVLSAAVRDRGAQHGEAATSTKTAFTV